MTSTSGLSPVACVAIIKNEEHKIPDCHQSVHRVDKSAVSDAGSCDHMEDSVRGGGAKEGNRCDVHKRTPTCLQPASIPEDIHSMR